MNPIGSDESSHDFIRHPPITSNESVEKNICSHYFQGVSICGFSFASDYICVCVLNEFDAESVYFTQPCLCFGFGIYLNFRLFKLWNSCYFRWNIKDDILICDNFLTVYRVWDLYAKQLITKLESIINE